jgi:hypothetical protein
VIAWPTWAWVSRRVLPGAPVMAMPPAFHC